VCIFMASKKITDLDTSKWSDDQVRVLLFYLETWGSLSFFFWMEYYNERFLLPFILSVLINTFFWLSLRLNIFWRFLINIASVAVLQGKWTFFCLLLMFFFLSTLQFSWNMNLIFPIDCFFYGAFQIEAFSVLC